MNPFLAGLQAGFSRRLSPASILNRMVPAAQAAVTGRPYAAGERGRLDLYLPGKGKGGAPATTVVFFYGGGWETGDKADYRFVGHALAGRGFVAAIPDYRLYPEVGFPAFVEDAAASVAFVRRIAADYGGDPRRMVLMGHSAGAYLAAMLCLDPQWLAAAGLHRNAIAAMVGLAGPYDFLPLHSETLKAIFGPPERLAATQPITFADGAAPPMLLATPRVDKAVEAGNSHRLAAKVRATGGVAEVVDYRGLTHASIVGALARPLQWLAPVLDDAVRFIAAQARCVPTEAA